MFGGHKVERSQLIDIAIGVGFAGNNVPVPDQPMLRNKRITGMEVYSQQDMPFSPITGNAVANINTIKQTSFTAYCGDPNNELDTGEYIYRFPLVGLHNQQTGGDSFVQRVIHFDDLTFQFEKCELVFTTPITPIVATSFVINVFYNSRKSRLSNLLGKKLGGISDGSLAEMLMAKIMAMEQKIAQMFKQNS